MCTLIYKSTDKLQLKLNSALARNIYFLIKKSKHQSKSHNTGKFKGICESGDSPLKVLLAYDRIRKGTTMDQLFNISSHEKLLLDFITYK